VPGGGGWRRDYSGMAAGGVVTRPTMALIGEGREDEAVLPLSALSGMLNTARSGGSDADAILAEIRRLVRALPSATALAVRDGILMA